MKTLYVSDLDGTLLRGDQRTSDFTNGVINSLAEKGVLFSYATARSYHTARKVTKGMTAAFPVIVYNGAFIRDNATGRLLIENYFDENDARGLLRHLIESGIAPIVYSFIDGAEKFSYVPPMLCKGAAEFIETRRGDGRDRPCAGTEELFAGDIFYFTCIDSPERLLPIYELYESRFNCFYQRDIYSGEQWLELMPKNASKANAVRQLADHLGCGRTVVFGDGINDIEMFTRADEAYAVLNAVEELKAAATGVIGSNEEDGVARWLSEHL